MIDYLVRQDLSQRFTGNTLGMVWVGLGPLLQLALFAFVFGLIFQARVPELGPMGYVSYLALGMWPWFAFSDAVGRGSTSYTEQAGLLEKVAIEPWLLVIARVIAAFLLHGAGFLLVLLLLSAITSFISFWLLPVTLLAWLALLVLAAGMAVVLSVFNVFFRDMQQIVQYALTAAMFLTPILYSSTTGPGTLRSLQEWNPFASMIFGIRDPLVYGDLSHVIPWTGLAAGLICGLLAWWCYRRFRPHLVDFL